MAVNYYVHLIKYQASRLKAPFGAISLLTRQANNAAYAQCFPLRQYSNALPAYPLRF